MKISQIHYKQEFDKARLDELSSINPNVIFVFGNTKFFADGTLGKILKDKFPAASIIGCSTAGEIFSHAVYNESLVITAAFIENTEIKLLQAEINIPEDSYKAAQSIAKEIASPETTSLFVLAPGTNINGSELVAGFASILSDKVTITGGLAGDATSFTKTYTLGNEEVSTNKVFVLSLESSSVNISYASKGGWLAFGPDRRVTKAKGNVLYEIDNRPALQLYKEYLGERAKELPASGLLYPFAVLNEENLNEVGIIRTILNVNEADNSLILAGDIKENSLVQLMHVKTQNLVEGAGSASKEAYNSSNKNSSGTSLAILVSCVGRKIVMGDDVDEEIDAVKDELANGTVLTGFYSYGEICPFDKHNNKPLLHNQTMTITLINQ